MTINTNKNYSQFYSGTSTIKTYNGNLIGKTQVVKYEFNTTDEQGNKVMDKMSKEKTLEVMNQISSQYGDGVIVEFSGDALATFVNGGKKGNFDHPVQITPEKQAAISEAIIQRENTYLIQIPNIQINDKLYSSLHGADENATKAANGIIKNFFLPSNIGNMSEEERQELIAFGMEDAKYIAQNYLDEEHSKEFLSAMETIAKYGMNGVVDQNGNVTYDIKKGPLVGAPDNYLDQMDILKEKAPDLYDEIKELNYNIINHKNGETFGTKFLELCKRAEKVLNGTSNKNGKTNLEVAVEEYSDWKNKIEETKLPTVFNSIKYNDLQNFFDSLQSQSSLSNSWLNENLNRFMKWLNLE